jgi:hypothetical protein
MNYKNVNKDKPILVINKPKQKELSGLERDIDLAIKNSLDCRIFVSNNNGSASFECKIIERDKFAIKISFTANEETVNEWVFKHFINSICIKGI